MVNTEGILQKPVSQFNLPIKEKKSVSEEEKKKYALFYSSGVEAVYGITETNGGPPNMTINDFENKDQVEESIGFWKRFVDAVLRKNNDIDLNPPKVKDLLNSKQLTMSELLSNPTTQKLLKEGRKALEIRKNILKKI